jgi:hypothetical protein
MDRSIRLTIATILLVLTWSCGSQRAVVGDGLLQKRRFRPGWHLDLPAAHKSSQPQRRSAHTTTSSQWDHVPATAVHEEIDATVTTAEVSSPLIPTPPARTYAPSVIDVPEVGSTDPRDLMPTPAHDAPVDSTTAKRWNPWAAPALATAVGSVAIGLFTTSTIAVLITVAIAIVLASIALRRGRENEWSGKGLALAAMIIAMLVVLATAAAIVVVGFV